VSSRQRTDLSSFADRPVYGYSCGTFVRAYGREARIARSGQQPEPVAVESPIQWVEVSPDGGSVLMYTDRGTRIWRWRHGLGVEPFLEVSNSRDILGCGFCALNGSIVTLVSKDRTLRGLAPEGGELFACNLRSPHSFIPRSFSQLPANRLALVGFFFSDPYDVAITVSFDELSRTSEAVQHAIAAQAPVRDRAVHIAVGSCPPNAAVVLRDPQDTELRDEDDDDEPGGDVENFTGVYIRDLDTGALIERHSYTGSSVRGSSIAATEDWIAVQVVGGVDMIRRGTGAVRNIPNAILDVWELQIATVEGDELASVTPIDSIV
jgi:hypothetical protein